MWLHVNKIAQSCLRLRRVACSHFFFLSLMKEVNLKRLRLLFDLALCRRNTLVWPLFLLKGAWFDIVGIARQFSSIWPICNDIFLFSWWYWHYCSHVWRYIEQLRLISTARRWRSHYILTLGHGHEGTFRAFFHFYFYLSLMSLSLK